MLQIIWYGFLGILGLCLSALALCLTYMGVKAILKGTKSLERF